MPDEHLPSERIAGAMPTLTKAAPTLGRWGLRGLVLAFVLLIVYALSIGPAILLNKHGKITGETLEMIYFPLSLLSGIPGVQPLLDRYINLWVPPEP